MHVMYIMKGLSFFLFFFIIYNDFTSKRCETLVSLIKKAGRLKKPPAVLLFKRSVFMGNSNFARTRYYSADFLDRLISGFFLNPGRFTHLAPQIIKACPSDSPFAGDLDFVDVGGIEREDPLDTNAE